jgi:hypothetical protein
MSQVYVDHFALAVDRLSNPVKALDVLERARTNGRGRSEQSRTQAGRPFASADRTGTKYRSTPDPADAGTRAERSQILEKLFEAEQDLWITRPNTIPRRLQRGQPVEFGHLQSSLTPRR